MRPNTATLHACATVSRATRYYYIVVTAVDSAAATDDHVAWSRLLEY